jgi:hypothetical protein
MEAIMNWRCKTCGELVSDKDMQGYCTDQNRQYIPGSLGFWHNTPECGRKAEHYAGTRIPHDIRIIDFKENLEQQWSYLFSLAANNETFKDDIIQFRNEVLGIEL